VTSWKELKVCILSLQVFEEHQPAACQNRRGNNAFWERKSPTDVKIGDMLETIEGGAFLDCCSLERIAIPLNHRIIDDIDDYVFPGCENLKHVDLVGGVHETIAALHLECWRNDVNAVINAINQILLNTPARRYTRMWWGKPGRSESG
jgi:hypothetical protein